MKKTCSLTFLFTSILTQFTCFSQEKQLLNYEDNQIVISNYLKIKNIKPAEDCDDIFFDENGRFSSYDSYEVGDNIYHFGDADLPNNFSDSEFITSYDVKSLDIHQRTVCGWGYHLSETEGIFFLSNTFYSDTLSYTLFSPDELTSINPFCAYSPWEKIKTKKTDLNDFLGAPSGYSSYNNLLFPSLEKVSTKKSKNSSQRKRASKFLNTYRQEFKDENLRFMEQAQEIKIVLTLTNNKKIIYYLTTETRTAEC